MCACLREIPPSATTVTSVSQCSTKKNKEVHLHKFLLFIHTLRTLQVSLERNGDCSAPAPSCSHRLITQPNPKQSEEDREDSTTITFVSTKRSSKCDLSTVCHSVIKTTVIIRVVSVRPLNRPQCEWSFPPLCHFSHPVTK